MSRQSSMSRSSREEAVTLLEVEQPMCYVLVGTGICGHRVDVGRLDVATDSLLPDRELPSTQFDVTGIDLGVPVQHSAVLAPCCRHSSFWSSRPQILHLAGVQAKISEREEPAASTMLVASEAPVVPGIPRQSPQMLRQPTWSPVSRWSISQLCRETARGDGVL